MTPVLVLLRFAHCSGMVYVLWTSCPKSSDHSGRPMCFLKLKVSSWGARWRVSAPLLKVLPHLSPLPHSYYCGRCFCFLWSRKIKYLDHYSHSSVFPLLFSDGDWRWERTLGKCPYIEIPVEQPTPGSRAAWKKWSLVLGVLASGRQEERIIPSIYVPKGRRCLWFLYVHWLCARYCTGHQRFKNEGKHNSYPCRFLAVVKRYN